MVSWRRRPRRAGFCPRISQLNRESAIEIAHEQSTSKAAGEGARPTHSQKKKRQDRPPAV